MRGLRGLAVATVAVSLLGLGLASPSHADTRATLDWAPCTDEGMTGLECSFLTVPLDWSEPDGRTIEIAMARHRSEGTPGERIGSMFFNPGGPGGSGLATLATAWSLLPAEARRHFDLVTWDPRGIGATEGLDCPAAQMPMPRAVGPVDWVAVQDRTRTAIRTANAQCQAKYPEIVQHMGTNANVEDLDAMRVAVGDAGLTYWAWSYGTRIGYVYALRHPDTVRAIVLDGSVSPNSAVLGFAAPYSAAADAGLNILFQQHPQASADYRVAHAALARAPLTLPDGRRYTQWDLGLALQEWASFESFYPVIAGYLQAVRLAVTGTGEEQAAAAAVVASVPALSADTLSTASGIIQCSDYADRPPAARQVAVATTARLAAPITGWFRGIATSMPCEGLRITPDPVPTFAGNDWSSRILMLGATLDTQTPYQWTVAMSTMFRAGRVVTYVGAKHVTLGSGSTCVDGYALDYVINGALPPIDVACPNNGPAEAGT